VALIDKRHVPLQLGRRHPANHLAEAPGSAVRSTAVPVHVVGQLGSAVAASPASTAVKSRTWVCTGPAAARAPSPPVRGGAPRPAECGLDHLEDQVVGHLSEQPVEVVVGGPEAPPGRSWPASHRARPATPRVGRRCSSAPPSGRPPARWPTGLDDRAERDPHGLEHEVMLVARSPNAARVRRPATASGRMRSRPASRGDAAPPGGSTGPRRAARSWLLVGQGVAGFQSWLR